MGDTSRVLLIHPPVSKPGEPPAGIARLAGALRRGGASCRTVDANLEGMLHLLRGPFAAPDRWTASAGRNVGRNLGELRGGTAFRSAGHYNRIVNDLNRLIETAGRGTDFVPGLADCGHRRLSAASGADLLRCAGRPQDDPFFPYYRDRILPLVEACAPEIAGLSVNFLSQAFCAFSLAGLLKSAFPSLPIVLGGGLVTSWMRSPGWKDPFRGLIDACVDGPGERFLLDRLGAEATASERAAPDFDGLDGPQYLSPGFVLPYDASSGCFWRRCRFCPERAEGNGYAPVPAELVSEDLKRLAERHGPALVHFLDNALPPALLDRFASDPPGVWWYGYARLEGRWIDPEFCVAMKKAGCVLLKIGLESGDPDVLEAMEKGIGLDEASAILNNLRNAGIPAYVYLLFGTPRESESSARRTLDFVLRHRESIGYINAALFNMPVSAADAAALATRPFSEGDLSLYTDFEHPLGWNRAAVRNFLDRTFRRHPVISEILARTPKRFTSNHAPFFHVDGIAPARRGPA